jgi:hypothetical protein
MRCGASWCAGSARRHDAADAPQPEAAGVRALPGLRRGFRRAPEQRVEQRWCKRDCAQAARHRARSARSKRPIAEKIRS